MADQTSEQRKKIALDYSLAKTKHSTPKTKPKLKSTAKQTIKIKKGKSPDLSDQSNIVTPFIIPLGTISNTKEKLYDSYCFLIHCLKHNKICTLKSLSTCLSSYIWLPFVAQSSRSCWTKTARNMVALILSNDSPQQCEYLKKNPPYENLQLIEILRFQLPQSMRFITRIAYYVRLNVANDYKKFICCQSTERLEWLDVDYVQKGVISNLWGPELVEFCSFLNEKQQTEQCLPQRIVEFGANQAFHYNPRAEQPRNLEEMLLKNVEITENDIERLYLDFLEHCYPSFYMTFDSFIQFMNHNGINLNDFNLKRLFNAFNYTSKGYLCFDEILLGLVAIEQDTPHEEVRIKFVFRYYDSNQHGVLYEEDIAKMIKDIITEWERVDATCQRPSEHELNRRTEEALSIFQAQLIRGRKAVIYKKFLSIIALRKFRGTSLLCRTKKSVFVNLAKRMTLNLSDKQQQPNLFSQVVKKKFYPETCKSCSSKKYKLNPFIMTINQDGYYEKSELIHQFQNEFDTTKWNKETFYPKELLSKNILLQQPEHPALFLMRNIREFNRIKDSLKPSGTMPGLMTAPDERERLFQMFQQLYVELEPMFESEHRVKSILSPCYVIGDIHGNLEDLISLETTLWKHYPCTTVHYLFLGDYVDRGRWSMECALYLFSMKALMPKMVTLLRGNHEIRDMQIKYTFQRELFQKYGPNYGRRFWESINKLFDRLPLCAIIDDTIFCCHGGIPHRAINRDLLEENIPPIIASPDEECPVAWEIMWSDPIHPDDFIAIKNLYKPTPTLNHQNMREGYTFNTKRGTAFYFNERAIENFLMENNLSYVVRAHEVPKMGFNFHFGHKCLTIFSCSHYCGNDNACGVLFVDRGKMRIISVDTSKNHSATDMI